MLSAVSIAAVLPGLESGCRPSTSGILRRDGSDPKSGVSYLIICMGFSYRLVGRDVSCVPGAAVMKRAGVAVAEGALATSARLRASGLWPAVNSSHRGDPLAVLCGCVNPSLLAELVQSKLECSEKLFRCGSVP